MKKEISIGTAVIIIILSCLVVGLTCTLLFTKGDNNSSDINSSDDKKSTEQTDQSKEESDLVARTSYVPKCVLEDEKIGFKSNESFYTDVDDNKYSTIFEYVLNQKNIKIVLRYVPQKSITDGSYTENQYEFTKEEVDMFFSDVKNDKGSMFFGGIGGAGVPTLTISYNRNGSEYNVSLWDGTVLSSNDGNIYKIIDKHVSGENTTGSNCHYSISKSTAYSEVLSKLDK